MTRTRPHRAAPPLPRPLRRGLVLTAYLGYAALLLAGSLLDSPWRWLCALPLGLVTLVALALLLMPRRLGIADGDEAQLDERQVALRNHSYLNAYRLVGALVILAAAYGVLAQGRGWWRPHTALEVQAVFWGAWLLVTTLPAALLAWTEGTLPEA